MTLHTFACCPAVRLLFSINGKKKGGHAVAMDLVALQQEQDN